jgi:hypothetical protein
VKAQQDIVIFWNSYYYNYQSEQRHERTYFPAGGAKNIILAISNSWSSHIYNFQKYDKVTMIAMPLIFTQI